MGAKVVAGIVGLIIVAVLAQTLFFGGDDNGGSLLDRGKSVPTATPPADPGEPVVLGQSQSSGGTGQTTTGGGSTASGATYTVQPGDTLGAIATQLGIPADEQAAWFLQVLDLNGMEDARQLQSGQELTLPARSASAAPTSAPTSSAATPTSTARPSATGTIATPSPTARPTGSGGTYTVVADDYPFLIAEKHCVDNASAWVDELLEINNATANSLSVGMVLDLPPGTPAFCGGASDDEDDADPTATPVP